MKKAKTKPTDNRILYNTNKPLIKTNGLKYYTGLSNTEVPFCMSEIRGGTKMKTFSRTVLSNGRTDEVYIPREVMCRENISDNTKLIFGIIFSECLSKMESIDEKNVTQATNMIKEIGTNIPLNLIEKNCFCEMKTAETIQKEFSSLTATLDIAACFYECKLNYINVQKPVCYVCDNGKVLYKLIDLVNTFVDRQLHNEKFKKVFTIDELKTLNAYDTNHSSELLCEVIDILKR